MKLVKIAPVLALAAGVGVLALYSNKEGTLAPPAAPDASEHARPAEPLPRTAPTIAAGEAAAEAERNRRIEAARAAAEAERDRLNEAAIQAERSSQAASSQQLVEEAARRQLAEAIQQRTARAFGEVDAALRSLVDGCAVFDVPTKMRAGRVRTIQASVGARSTCGALLQRAAESPEQAGVAIRVAPRMAATLSGSAFTISPEGPQVQLVGTADPATWVWQVTPKDHGQQELVLRFDVFVTINGSESSRAINVLTRSIDVEVDWPASVTEWLRALTEMGKNIHWLWTALLVPLWPLWRTWRRRRTRKATSATSVGREAGADADSAASGGVSEAAHQKR